MNILALSKSNYELAKFLCENIAESGISKDISFDLKAAEESLKDVKGDFYETLHLYTLLNDIVQDRDYGMPQIQLDHQKERGTYESLSELLFIAEAKHCINISMKPTNSSDEENLFGLSKTDFEFDFPQNKTLHENIQFVLIPEAEKRLKSLCLDLHRYFHPANEDSEGLGLAKASKLPYFIKAEKDELAEIKRKLAKEENKCEDLFEENLTKMSELLKKMEDNYLNNDQLHYLEMNRVEADWLAAKCDYYYSKARVMKNRILFETYTPECLDALRKVSCHLRNQIGSTRGEIKKIEESLKQYESAGNIFTGLLKEYNRLTMIIDDKKWALTELRNSNGK